MKLFKFAAVFLVISVFCLQSTISANILGVFPSAGRSVNYLYQRLLKGLADAGHTITSISPYQFDLGIGNGSVRDVILTGFSDRLDRELARASYEYTPESSLRMDEGLWAYNKTLWHRNVREFLKDKTLHFDVVIIDHHLWSDLLLVFSKIFDCPTVVFSSTGDPFATTLVGNFLPPSYVKHHYMPASHNHMNYIDRLYNFLFYFYDSAFRNFYLTPKCNQLLRAAYKKRFKSGIDVAALRKRVSLVLLNSHPSIRPAVPLVPNAIEVAGFHIDPPQELQERLLQVLNQATEGVVFFSMGLGVRTRNIPVEKKQLFLNVFKKLNLTVIWKVDGEPLPEDLPNVFTIRWAPQRDLLAHPNVKLFINQGGYNSLIEAVHHGIPSLTLPIFPEDLNHCIQAELDGYSLNIPYKNLTEESVYVKIMDLLRDSKYGNSAKKRSKLFLDRPIKPLNSAVYWIEYVIRNKGAEHLKVAAVELPLYKFFMLDVFGAFVAVGLAIVYGFKFVCSRICKRQVRKTPQRKRKTL